MHCIVLFCAELCCAVSYCIILYCIAYSARQSKSPTGSKNRKNTRKACLIGLVWEMEVPGDGLLARGVGLYGSASPDPLLVGTRRYVLVQTGSKHFCRKMFCNMLQISVMFAIALLRESSFNMTRGDEDIEGGTRKFFRHLKRGL